MLVLSKSDLKYLIQSASLPFGVKKGYLAFHSWMDGTCHTLTLYTENVGGLLGIWKHHKTTRLDGCDFPGSLMI